MSTRQKLASIEDNSFGSNDMVVSLKKELEEELMEKARLQEQITVLQKELENAADAGIELNKIVAELLSNQTGDESIISSVEELQKQLNEQQSKYKFIFRRTKIFYYILYNRYHFGNQCQFG